MYKQSLGDPVHAKVLKNHRMVGMMSSAKRKKAKS